MEDNKLSKNNKATAEQLLELRTIQYQISALMLEVKAKQEEFQNKHNQLVSELQNKAVSLRNELGYDDTYFLDLDSLTFKKQA